MGREEGTRQFGGRPMTSRSIATIVTFAFHPGGATPPGRWTSTLPSAGVRVDPSFQS
jgi:hypothetical protein